MITFDFSKTAAALRKILWESTQSLERRGAWEAVAAGEGEIAVQTILFLYDHLLQFEQWASAAHLVAWCVPTALRQDPRILDLIDKARKVADQIDDPEKEALFVRLHAIHEMPDNFMTDLRLAPPRAKYLYQVARLTGAHKVAEFGTGCGSNMMHAHPIMPDIEWTGIDLNPKQIEFTQAQADRVGIPVKFLTDPAPDAFGSFDVVGCLDVLEHTMYPETVIDKVEKYVKPGGMIVIAVPNGPWSLHTVNSVNAGPGQHVNVGSDIDLLNLVARRGRVIDIDVRPGPIVIDANSSVCIAYQLNVEDPR